MGYWLNNAFSTGINLRLCFYAAGTIAEPYRPRDNMDAAYLCVSKMVDLVQHYILKPFSRVSG